MLHTYIIEGILIPQTSCQRDSFAASNNDTVLQLRDFAPWSDVHEGNVAEVQHATPLLVSILPGNEHPETHHDDIKNGAVP